MLVMLINLIFSLYGMAVLLRILFQFIKADYFNPLSQTIAKLTNYPCRQINRLAPRKLPIDISAIILFLIVEIVKLLMIEWISVGMVTVLGILTATISDSIYQLLNLYFYIIFIVSLASWIAPERPHPSLILLKKLADPVLDLVRRIIPPFHNIDFSPLIVLILIKLIELIVLMPFLGAVGIG